LGMAIAARRLMMATTIIISKIENAFRRFDIRVRVQQTEYQNQFPSAISIVISLNLG
jgi:hypothetical protein